MEKAVINRVLFDFTSLIDVDVGMALLMSTKYNNPAIVNQKVAGRTIDEYKVLMLNRIYRNPLVMFLNDDFKREADDLYVEMITGEEVYKEVLKRSITTSIFTMLESSTFQPSIEPTVLCWNQWQADYFNEATKNKYRLLVVKDGTDTVDVKDYDTLIFKYPYSLQMFSNVNGKNIYICKYRCNMNKEDINRLEMTDDIKSYHYNANDIYIIDVYANTTLDVSKEEI